MTTRKWAQDITKIVRTFTLCAAAFAALLPAAVARAGGGTFGTDVILNVQPDGAPPPGLDDQECFFIDSDPDYGHAAGDALGMELNVRLSDTQADNFTPRILAKWASTSGVNSVTLVGDMTTSGTFGYCILYVEVRSLDGEFYGLMYAEQWPGGSNSFWCTNTNCDQINEPWSGSQTINFNSSGNGVYIYLWCMTDLTGDNDVAKLTARVTAGRSPAACDVDGDGLEDVWELAGEVDGTYTFPDDMKPSPVHKDLFVEVDSMVGHGFISTAAGAVRLAFFEAPNDLVNNPDGLDGITLHLLVDETNLPVQPFPNFWDDFDVVKEAHFGTPAERADPNWPNIEAAKKKAFRYCIFGQSLGGTTKSGMAERPGNDFLVALGLWPTLGGTADQQAGVFMHELGHTLNLDHGGGDDVNRKPNYYSVMSYTWQMPKSSYSAFWRLDYSHVQLDDLNEAALVESAGIDGSDPAFAAIKSLIGRGGEPPVLAWASPNGVPLDWNGNGVLDPGTVAADINYHFQCGSPPVPCPSPDQLLKGHADWPNLRYELFGHPNFTDGVHLVTTEGTEMTVEIFEQMDTTPPPPSAADITGPSGVPDGCVDAFDLGAMLGAWCSGVNDPNPPSPPCENCTPANLAVADISGAAMVPDGCVDAFDLAKLLAEWCSVAGGNPCGTCFP